MVENGIHITEVRVRNFRCRCSVDVKLAKFVVLLGPNIAGKTSFLYALYAAIDIGQNCVHQAYYSLSKADRIIPKARAITIDILILPTSEERTIIDAFPEGSPWFEP